MNEEQFKYVAMLMTAVLCPCVVVTNAFAVGILLWSPKMRGKSPVVLILNLLLTHLLQGVLVMPIYTIRKAGNYPDWMNPYITCDAWRMSYMVTFYGTCVFVLLVAVDRFIAVRFALLYKSFLKYKHFLVAVSLAWFFIISLCVIPFLNHAKSSCHYNQQFQWTVFMLFVNTVAPYVLVIICYLYIIKSLRISTRKVSGSINKTKTKKSDLNRKITMLSLRLTVIYGITWAPSIIYYCIVALTPDVFSKAYYESSEEKLVTFLIKYITFFDGLLAPFLYCYYHCVFRNEIKRFFRIHFCKKTRKLKLPKSSLS